MRRTRALLLAIAASLGALSGCTSSGMSVTPPGEVIPSGERELAPRLAGELLDGQLFDPESIAEQVTVINFWGSWCGPCRLEVPHLQELAADNEDEDVAVVGIDVKDNSQQARQFLADRAVSYPSLADPRGEISSVFSDFPVYRTPSTMVLDRSGHVAAVHLGEVESQDLQQTLDQLLDEK